MAPCLPSGRGVSSTLALGSKGDVIAGAVSEIRLAQRVLAKFFPSEIKVSPFANLTFFFVQKTLFLRRYET
jgi:hypothetical protein